MADDYDATDTSAEPTAVADTTTDVDPATADTVDSTLSWDTPAATDTIDPEAQDDAANDQWDATMQQGDAADQAWDGQLADGNAANAEWNAQNATDPQDQQW